MLGLFRHRRVAALLSSYIDGQVTREERSVVEGHLPGCETCSRDLDELRQTASLMSGLPVLAPGRTYVLSSLSPRETPARRSASAFFAPGIAAAACAVLLVVIVSGQAAGVLVQSGGDETMFESSADAPTTADQDMFQSQADEPMPEDMAKDMAADDESFTTFGEEAASDEQFEEELALAEVAEVEVQQSSEVAASEALSEALEESAAMEMPSEFLSDFEDAPAADEGDFMAMAPEDMSEEAGQVSSLEASARAAGSEEKSSDDQEQPESALTADVATVVDEDTGIEAADMAEESVEAEQVSSLEASARVAGSEEEFSDDQEQPEAALTADAATVVDEDTGIEAADMAEAELTPAVARSQPDVGAAQDDQAGGVELPLWQIEVGVGAVIALLLVAAYSAGRKRR